MPIEEYKRKPWRLGEEQGPGVETGRSLIDPVDMSPDFSTIEYILARDNVPMNAARTPPESWYHNFVKTNYPKQFIEGTRENADDIGEPLFTLLRMDGQLPVTQMQQRYRRKAINPLINQFYKEGFYGTIPSGPYEGQNAELHMQTPSVNPNEPPPRGVIKSTLATIGAGAMKALDFIQRGQYGSAKMFDVLQSDGWIAMGKALSAAGKEMWDPQERLSFEDVINNVNPGLKESSPWMSKFLGFVGDVVMDPTTYLTFGAGPGLKVLIKGGKIAGKGAKTMRMTEQGAEYVRRMVASGADKPAVDEMMSQMFRIHKSASAGRFKMPGGAKLFHEEGRYVGMKLPIAGYVGGKPGKHIKKAVEQIPIMGNAVKAVTKHGQSVKKRLANTKLGEALSEGFIKADKRVTEEYALAKSKIFGRYAIEEKQMIQAVNKIFMGMDQKSVTAIGEASHEIQDETVRWFQENGKDMVGFHALPSGEQKRITQKVFDKFGLDTKQRGAYTTFRQKLTDLGATENEMELAIDEMVNYSPRFYSLAKDDTYIFTAAKSWESAMFGHAKQRKFATVKDAMDAGYVPEMNAAEMLSRRWMASIKARRNQELKTFSDNLLEEFDSAIKGGKKPKFTKKEIDIIKKDIHQIGMADTGFDNGFMEMLERGYNGIHSLFRRSATTWRIGFGVRTGVDNLVRMYTLQGAKAAGGFTPEAQKMSHAILTAVKLGDPSILKGMTYRDGLGQAWSGHELYDEAIKYNVVQDMATGGVKSEKKLMTRLKEADSTYAWMEKSKAGKMTPEAAHEAAWKGGLVNLAKNSWKFWNWSAEIENVSRMTVFMNSIGHGADPFLAAKDVNKVLFDYSKGLTHFEDRWMKKIIPFYTYQRFIFPALAHVMVTNPGQVANTKKAVEGFLSGVNKAFGGEELNESERQVLPGWLLEQPTTYIGMGQDLQAHFAAFNNFQPLDTLGFLEMDETGREVDYERTAAKTLFSVLSPLIKMPFEVLMNRNLFTDRVIESTATEQGLEKLSEAGVLVENFAKVHSAAGELVPEVIAASIPEAIKDMIGFEVVTDMRDGKRKAFVNPYMAYGAAAIMPVVRDVIRVIDGKLTPYESAVSVILGVSNYKLDLQQQLTFKQKQYEMMVKSASAKVLRAKKQGRWKTEEKLLGDLQGIVEYTSDQWSKIRGDDVRGLGFEPQDRLDYYEGRYHPGSPNPRPSPVGSLVDLEDFLKQEKARHGKY